jgi:hypothetical protein
MAVCSDELMFESATGRCTARANWGRSSRQERSPLYNVLQKRREWVQEWCLERKESNSQHSGRPPVVTAQVVEKDRWGREPMPPRSVPGTSAQAELLTARGVGAGSSLDRRRNTLFPLRAVWTAMRIEGSAAIDI